MYRQFKKFLIDNELVLKDEKILLGISGGADSMSMLHLFLLFRDEFKNEIAVAHLNHGIRGKEADEDEEYVRIFCRNNLIPFMSKKVNLYDIVKETKMTIEEAGRVLRYSFFDECLKKLNYDKIATAHNEDDNVETVLMNIIRGSGIDGISGIKKKRDNIIRPMIIFKRDKIDEYCIKNNIIPRTDFTNKDNIYFRNKIRNELIPYLKVNFNVSICESIIRLSENAAEDCNYLNKIAKGCLEKYCKLNGDSVIIKKDIFDLDEAIINRVLRESFKLLKDSLSNVEKKHIKDIIDLQKNSSGKMIDLKESITAVNSYGDIHLFKKLLSYEQILYKELYIGENVIENFDYYINIDIISNDKFNLTKNKYPLVKYFDYSKIKNKKIILRNRKDDDFFNPLGMDGKKKLNQYFIDKKVPRRDRDNISLICFGEEIGWIFNHQISNKFKITYETCEVLKIEFKERSTIKNDGI